MHVYKCRSIHFFYINKHVCNDMSVKNYRLEEYFNKFKCLKINIYGFTTQILVLKRRNHHMKKWCKD